jgi:hypothetical protein
MPYVDEGAHVDGKAIAGRGPRGDDAVDKVRACAYQRPAAHAARRVCRVVQVAWSLDQAAARCPVLLNLPLRAAAVHGELEDVVLRASPPRCGSTPCRENRGRGPLPPCQARSCLAPWSSESRSTRVGRAVASIGSSPRQRPDGQGASVRLKCGSRDELTFGKPSVASSSSSRCPRRSRPRRSRSRRARWACSTSARRSPSETRTQASRHPFPATPRRRALRST